MTTTLDLMGANQTHTAPAIERGTISSIDKDKVIIGWEQGGTSTMSLAQLERHAPLIRVGTGVRANITRCIQGGAVISDGVSLDHATEMPTGKSDNLGFDGVLNVTMAIS